MEYNHSHSALHSLTHLLTNPLATLTVLLTDDEQELALGVLEGKGQAGEAESEEDGSDEDEEDDERLVPADRAEAVVGPANAHIVSAAVRSKPSKPLISELDDS